MRHVWTTAAVGGLILAASAAAQETTRTDLSLYGPQEGENQWEVILTGSGSNDNDFDSGAFNVNVELGYYFTPELYVAIRQGVGFSDFGDQAWNGSTTGAFDYHFVLDRFRPFVGVSFGGLYGDTTNDTFIAGPEAGLKWYVYEQTFLYGRVAYEFIFDDVDDADEGFDDGRFVYVIGVGFNF